MSASSAAVEELGSVSLEGTERLNGRTLVIGIEGGVCMNDVANAGASQIVDLQKFRFTAGDKATHCERAD